jgi:phosphotriesterase-related protein
MMPNSKFQGKAQTVLGPIAPELLGTTLVHEHLMIDESKQFMEPTAASERHFAYQPVSLENLWWVRLHPLNNLDNVRFTDEQLAIKESLQYKLQGGNTIVEVTTGAVLGRDPLGLVRISRSTGLNIVMGAGYHIEALHPADLASRSEQDITEELIRDITVGVGDTGVRAGIIGEIGCSLPLKNGEKKVLQCCAAAQQNTGVAIYIHPSADNEIVLNIIKILHDAGADLGRVIIGHVDISGFSGATIRKILDMGCNIGFDSFGFEGFIRPPRESRVVELSDAKRINDIKDLIGEGHLSKIFISQDVATKERLISYGGTGYAHIIRDLVPVMKIKGISEKEIKVLLVDNPKRVLTLAKTSA